MASGPGCETKFTSLRGDQPDAGQHGLDERLPAPVRHADCPADEATDRRDLRACEELEATRVHAAQQDQRNAGVELHQVAEYVVDVEVEFAGDQQWHGPRRGDVLDVSESLGAEQLLGHPQGSEASDVVRESGQSNPGRFERRFSGCNAGTTEQSRRAEKRSGGDDVAPPPRGIRHAFNPLPRRRPR